MGRNHFWLGIGVLAVGGLLAASPSPALAQQVEICNPVLDGSGDPVVSTAGGSVLHSGSAPCPPRVAAVVEAPPPVAPAAGPEPIEERVFFEFDESEIEPEFVDDLNRVAEQVQTDVWADDAVYLVGHTDAIGTEQYNIGLSERRAESVAEFLTDRGVARDRLVLEAEGESEPIATNETPEGRAQNRRVVITAGEPATS